MMINDNHQPSPVYTAERGRQLTEQQIDSTAKKAAERKKRIASAYYIEEEGSTGLDGNT